MVLVRKSNGMVKIGLLTECDCLFIQILHFDIPGKGSDDSFYMCINNIHVCWDNVLHHVADVLKMLYRSGKVMNFFLLPRLWSRSFSGDDLLQIIGVVQLFQTLSYRNN